MVKIRLSKAINVHSTTGLVITIKAGVELHVSVDDVFDGYTFEKDLEKFFIASYEAVRC